MLTTATLNALAAYNLPTTVPAQFETTTSALFAEYQATVGLLGQIGSSATPYTNTDGNTTQLNTAVTTLINRLQNGDGNGHYYTIDMANNLNYLLQSLTTIGITVKQSGTAFVITGDASSTIVPPPAPTTAQWNSWRDLLLTSNILQPLFTSAAKNTSNRNLQAMVELDYVGTGNNLLSQQLTNLQQGINVTQTILNTLGDLQQAHNNIVVANKPPFSSFFDVNQPRSNFANSAAFETAYKAAASAYFNAPIIPAIAGVPPAGYRVATTTAPVYALSSSSLAGLQGFSNLQNVTSLATNPATFGTINPSAAGNQANPQNQTVFRITSGNTLIGGVNYNVIAYGSDQNGPYSINLADYTTVDFGNQFQSGNYTSHYFSDMVIPKPGTTLSQAFLDKYGLSAVTVSLLDPANPNNHPNQFVAYTVSTVPPGGTSSGTTQSKALETDSIAAQSINLNSLVNLGGGYMGIPASQLSTTGTVSYTAPGPNIGETVTRTVGLLSTFGWSPIIKNGDFFAFSAVGLPGRFTVLPGTGTGTSLLSVKNRLVQLLGVLSAQIPLLSGLTPGAAGVSDQTTLLARVKTVYNNLKDVFKVAGGAQITANTSLSASMSGLTAWLLDKYNTPVTSNNGGIYQNNITSAVTAAQSLNSQQQNNVRNFLYVFQEYQQSASSILQQLTQIIERMAQGIK